MKRFQNLLVALAAVAAVHATLFPGAAAATTHAETYHIGNSLTADLAPQSLAAFAAQRGQTHTVGYHIRVSSTLAGTLAHPDETSTPSPDPFGAFATALPGYHWNAVTLQPHPGEGATLASDVDAILYWINLTRSNPANANTRFYIYATWPIIGDFQNKWSTPVVDDDDALSIPAHDYYRLLIERVRLETDATVLMLPVGDVLAELDRRLAAGAVPGYSRVSSFYRDGLHMNGELGQYTAAATAFATLRAQNPVGLVKPDGVFTFEGTAEHADVIYPLINDVIREVVGNHPYTGVTFPDPPRADFDGSGVVDGADLALLDQSLDKSPAADANADGEVDAADMQIWMSQLGFTSRRTSNFDSTDVNADGLTDSADLAVWQQSAGTNAGYDMDGDGDTDGGDLLAWQRGATSCYPGDFNRDYVVDARDFNVWQANAGFTLRADANGDGQVDQQDYAIWEQEEGRVWPEPFPFPEVTATPEPASFELWGAAACLTFTRRGRAAAPPRRRPRAPAKPRLAPGPARTVR